MVRNTDLVILGISVGAAAGILIASLILFGICWYKKRAHLPRSANECSLATLPMRENGLGTSIESSASLSNSVIIKRSDYLARKPQNSWWINHSKDRFASASGLPRYSYKDIQKATQNFTTILGQGSFGPVYKAVMPTGELFAVKVLASDSKQGEKEFHTEASMSPDGVDEILDTRIVGTCNPIEVRSLARIAHKCLHKIPRKRPSIGEVSQAILKTKNRRLVKEDTMSLVGEDISRAMSRIETQQLELRKMTSINEI
ncbi:calcium calmodulin-regulated receptor-like kinase 2 [Olea europaea subsp. europaea]|uniref:Calcium calmodulin-regulated receptor-like kinase 2 n=1 Tax=Olea europaea subsp. europaea TaxID=158383 RepID=A0A8S0SCR1_OLEEU|nr:calcium calmodulin-regulated receptor-like kinase 2 [Olea europaea subsp. europaea]